MTNYAIRVQQLGKQYRIGGAQAPYRTLRESLSDLVRAPFRRREPPKSFWALNDVSFDVAQGDVVGIIGRNGAGKSTLLKILSRITAPTKGRIELQGRVSSLLEVGTGFHAELTGRENVFLNGSILGMSRHEIVRKFDEIVAFAEVEQFIDTAVKHYSSGMYMRLAFAVAAHLEPEIMIVDEVLAVGDAAFQQKCLGKMGDAAREGRTVLFVSHDLNAILTLCPRSLLFHQGQLIRQGATSEIVAFYLDRANKVYSSIPNTVQGDQSEIQLNRVSVKQHGQLTNTVYAYDPIHVEIEYTIPKLIRNLRLFLSLQNERGETIYITSDYDSANLILERAAGVYRSELILPGNVFKAGTIHASFGADIPRDRVVLLIDDAVSFDVLDSAANVAAERQNRIGMVAPIIPWTSEVLKN